jgi:hypothetical protein
MSAIPGAGQEVDEPERCPVAEAEVEDLAGIDLILAGIATRPIATSW